MVSPPQILPRQAAPAQSATAVPWLPRTRPPTTDGSTRPRHATKGCCDHPTQCRLPAPGVRTPLPAGPAPARCHPRLDRLPAAGRRPERGRPGAPPDEGRPAGHRRRRHHGHPGPRPRPGRRRVRGGSDQLHPQGRRQEGPGQEGRRPDALHRRVRRRTGHQDCDQDHRHRQGRTVRTGRQVSQGDARQEGCQGHRGGRRQDRRRQGRGADGRRGRGPGLPGRRRGRRRGGRRRGRRSDRRRADRRRPRRRRRGRRRPQGAAGRCRSGPRQGREEGRRGGD